MSQDSLNKLPISMKSISEVVNSFNSEDIQKSAFRVLLGEAGIKQDFIEITGHPLASVSQDKTESITVADEETLATKKPKRHRSNASKPNIKFVDDLDLYPSNKLSFVDFAEQKKPKDMQERVAVIVFYLKEILNIKNLQPAHIATVFRLKEGWKEPTNILSILTNTSTRKKTINSSDLNDIQITPVGRNFVNLELPKPSK